MNQSSTSTNDTSDAFFQAWRIYEMVIERNYMRHVEIASALRRLLGQRIAPVQSILELGCGDSRFAAEIFGECSGIDYLGIDLSKEALDLAFQKSESLAWNARWLQQDQRSALHQLAAGNFDLILAGFTFHHLTGTELDSVLPEARRLLKPTGSLVVYDVLREDDESREAYIGRQRDYFDTAWDAFSADQLQAISEHISAHDYPLCRNEWHCHATEAGFAEVEELYRDPERHYALMVLHPGTGRQASLPAS